MPIVPNTRATKPTHADVSSPTPGRNSTATCTSSSSVPPMPARGSPASLPRVVASSSFPRAAPWLPRPARHPAQPAIPPSPAIMLTPQRSHRHSSSLQSSHGIPPLPPPPSPRPRQTPLGQLWRVFVSSRTAPPQNTPAASATTTGYVLHPHLCPISHPTSPIYVAASMSMSRAAPISHRPIPCFSPPSRPHGTRMRAHTRDRRPARPSAPSRSMRCSSRHLPRTHVPVANHSPHAPLSHATNTPTLPRPAASARSSARSQALRLGL